MSLKGFQRAVVDLTLAPQSVRALRSGECAQLDRYDLNKRERDRLVEISRQPGMAMNCSLARGNRLELIVAAFPRTCTLLKPLLPGLLDELWEHYKPDNYQLFGEEAAFAAFVARKIAAGELAVEYLPEILAYEIACQELAFEREACAGAGPDLEAGVQFQHPPGQLLEPLNRFALPASGLPAGTFPARIRLTESGFDLEFLPT